jgi:hypothetical protein
VAARATVCSNCSNAAASSSWLNSGVVTTKLEHVLPGFVERSAVHHATPDVVPPRRLRSNVANLPPLWRVVSAASCALICADVNRKCIVTQGNWMIAECCATVRRADPESPARHHPHGAGSRRDRPRSMASVGSPSVAAFAASSHLNAPAAVTLDINNCRSGVSRHYAVAAPVR